VPFADVRFIIGRACTLGALHIDETIGPVLDEALANIDAELLQGFFLRPFVGNEKDIDFIESIDGLNRDVVGIARANADDENFPHDAPYRLNHVQSGSTLT
jgi:hypothetical protein